MDTSREPERSHLPPHQTARTFPTWRLPLLLLVFAVLLATRRWAQLTSPQVWCEEGEMVIGFLERGLPYLFQPMAGYLVLVPKAIVRLSLAVSLYHYPAISTALTWILIAAVGTTIAVAPTHLKGRFACAVAVFAIPCDPEVFGLALYTLWWVSLCLFLLPLWDETRPCPGLRMGILLGGGLSSPLIIAVLPALYYRAFRFRRLPWEPTIAALATAIALLQMHFMSLGPTGALPPAISILRHVIPKFSGWMLLGNFSENPVLLWVSGLAVLVLFGTYCFRERRRVWTWLLVFLWGAAVAASVARVDPAIPHPGLAGPRYFFFPYVLTFWILVQLLLSVTYRWIQIVVATVLALSLANALPVWSRPHEDLHWRAHVRSSRLFARYDFTIQYDGAAADAWPIGAAGPTWERFLRHDWIGKACGLERRPTFAYRMVLGQDETAPPLPIPGAGAGPTLSHEFSPSGKPVITLSLRRGDRLRYRSSPEGPIPTMRVDGAMEDFMSELPVTKGWQTLEFSNARLPMEFAITVPDDGQAAQHWALP